MTGVLLTNTSADHGRVSCLANYADGLHDDISAAVYHTPLLGLMSKSALDSLLRSPAHYLAWLHGEAEEESTPALEFGQQFHCSLLEPDVFSSTYVAEPNFGDLRKTDRTTSEAAKANKDRRDEWRAANEGKKLIDELALRHIEGMTASIRAHSIAGPALEEGAKELTALWHDKRTGVRCRARADCYSRRYSMLVDVKTTHDARLFAFTRDAFRYKYHLQHALYRMGFHACGEEVKHFVFVAVEKKPPYAIGVHTLDNAGIRLAYETVCRGLDTMAACLAKNAWPAYDEEITTMQTPKWLEGSETT